MDFQLRALKNGYQNVIQLDAFINNMSTMGVLNDISEIDTGVFYEKWGVQYLKSRPNKIMYENILENRNRQIANILEIGCGCGENLLILKNLFPNASLYGVDINPSAVSISSNIANVVCMDIEKDEVPFKGMKFDLIIFDNVLQHFVFPKDVLAKCRGYLDDVGLVISVIPNIQHISILKELIYGKFTYSGNELLEKNNYHLFTGQEILKIFPEAGYLVLKISYFSGYNTLEEIETYDKLMKAFPEVTDFEMNALYYIVKARKCD
jgi:2-polyprenyl-3-methyl-5-hydroxy-6-metoxy-1,4-benzoquinol methylase